MAALRKELALDPDLIRGLRNRLLKRFLPDSVAIGDFPEPQRLVLHCLELYRRSDSEIDGATKLLFRTAAGMLIESVILRIASGRTTLCISSQVGCAAACDFCATGRMGIATCSGVIVSDLQQWVRHGYHSHRIEVEDDWRKNSRRETDTKPHSRVQIEYDNDRPIQ